MPVLPAAERKRGVLPSLADAGRGEILVDKGFELMVRRHLVPLAAFLVQPHPPALALGIVVLDLHCDDGADAGEGIGHDADQRAVAQADDRRCVDAVE